MVGLLTWPAYGTWFARPHRGWIDREGDDAEVLPEPTRSHARRRQRLVWPPVTLDERRQAVVIRDLARVASLRSFELLMVAAAPDHVHVLLACAPDRDVPRLVQLIKGALSRALTVAAGDAPAASTRGRALIHHKWWTRQYSFRWLEDGPTRQRVVRALRAHADEDATVWEAPPPPAGAPADMGE
ncbi:MAG: transposase [Planctomycetota bacterium]|jgi:REP element-mobilizing transposase RayT